MRLLTGLKGLLVMLGLAISTVAHAEDGYDLWLRYRPVEAAWRERYLASPALVAPATLSPTLTAARNELARGLGGLSGRAPQAMTAVDRDGAVVFGTPGASPIIARLDLPLKTQGPEGYLIRTVTVDGHKATVIAANSDVGVLYGVFRYLRLIQTRQPLDKLDVADAPKIKLRMLNHWDNLNRSVERGYAGQSIWDWHKLPDYRDPRYTDYARANASIGVNGTVLNNVNAKADSLAPMYIEKAAALADVFRPYGIKVYLSARWSSPIEIGGLKTADPADPAVKAWWTAKIDEVYRAIPDFGGLVVKANSEGEPGPQDYGRTHADGANMLADAIAPHGGVILWRAFVYSHEQPDDRAKQGYNEFKPFDGQFRDNVIIQVKNGAIDFQPREPFHPLFGAMPKTALGMEFQITKEYLGQATHLAYLGPLFEETLKADTYAKGKGSTVAKVIDGSLDDHKLTAMAGVANIGTDRNWSGSQFDQANWYAFGRLAWDPEASSKTIAQDWAKMTFSNDPAFVEPVVGMMMTSREAVVDYMTPLGLHHQMANHHHYGPQPWFSGGVRADWTPVYYNKAAKDGIGFDRSSTGSDAVAQYAPPVAKMFDDLKTTPEQDLLWFHHVPWTYKTRSGRILWDEMVYRYTRGVSAVAQMRKTWDGVKSDIDPERAAQVTDFLAIQQKEAQWWRDASIAYFQTFSGLPLPEGYAAPAHTLDYYKALDYPYAPGI